LVGLHFGQLFHKLIWSPWFGATLKKYFFWGEPVWLSGKVAKNDKINEIAPHLGQPLFEKKYFLLASCMDSLPHNHVCGTTCGSG
jgi:hypothetical protein